MITFKQLIDSCNMFLYKHMYPTGNLQFASPQHRDLIRTFMAGAMEFIILSNNKKQMEFLIKDYELIAKEDWWPDARFKNTYLNRN